MVISPYEYTGLAGGGLLYNDLPDTFGSTVGLRFGDTLYGYSGPYDPDVLRITVGNEGSYQFWIREFLVGTDIPPPTDWSGGTSVEILTAGGASLGFTRSYENDGRVTVHLTAGTYYLRVLGENAGNQYTLVADYLSADETIGVGEALRLNQWVADGLGFIGDSDHYALTTLVGRRYGVLLVSGGADIDGYVQRTSTLEPALRLQSTYGTPEQRFAMGTFTATGTAYAVAVTGTEPTDQSAYVLAASRITRLTAGNDEATVTTRVGWIEAGAGNDTLAAGRGISVLDGGDGNDVLVGGGYSGVLIGGRGDDLFYVFGEDTVIERSGQGNDTIIAAFDASLMNSPHVEALVLTGRAIYGQGSDRANILTGNDQANRLEGMAGDDRIFGGAGNDTIDGGRGADVIIGGAGRDQMDGGVDRATDVFVFYGAADSPRGTGRDTIVNFRAEDRIDLSALDASPDPGQQHLVFSALGARAGAVWTVAVTGGVMVRADVTGDRTPDLEILVQGVTSLGPDAFLL